MKLMTNPIAAGIEQMLQNYRSNLSKHHDHAPRPPH